MPSKLAASSPSRNFLNEALVTAGFLGRFPKIPGTAGTLGGVLIAALLPWDSLFPLWAGMAALIVCGIGFALAPWAEQFYGRKDPSQFVLDEVAGFLVTVMSGQPKWTLLALGFFLFRLFDVWKPFPIRRLEKLPSGAGILLDDLAAGAYACMLLSAVRLLFPEL